MKCKLCGQFCFAKADLSTTGWKSISSCCGAEIDLTDDYSNDAMQGIRPNFPENVIIRYPIEIKSLRDEIAIETMKIILAEEIKPKPVMKSERIPEDNKKQMADYCYSLADSFMERRGI